MKTRGSDTKNSQKTAELLQKVSHKLLSKIDKNLKNKAFDLNSNIFCAKPLALTLEKLGKLLVTLSLLEKGYVLPPGDDYTAISAEDIELMRTLAIHSRQRFFAQSRVAIPAAAPDSES